jgi:release factor glutamine methyltransferase
VSAVPAADAPSWAITELRSAGCFFAEDAARVLVGAARSPAEFVEMVARRRDGLPLEQVVGWAQFCGRRIAVAPGVFVPRRRSEALALTAVSIHRRGRSRPSAKPIVVELCCGTGAVGLALISLLGGGELHAVDIEPAAVACARRNLATVGGHTYEGDLDGPLPARLVGRVDLLVANAPYVPTAELGLLPAEARDHEPRVALDGGADGVDLHRRIAARATRWLAPNGHLLIETSERQAELTCAAVVDEGLTADVVRDDTRAATVVVGSRAGASSVG